MIAFTIRRLFQAMIVMLTVGMVAFALFRFVGDPVESMAAEDDTAEFRAQLAERLGLDDPAPIQFGRYLLNCVRGEFGISYRNKRPVSELIADRLPATLELVLCASIIALAIGIPLGVYTGLHRNTLTSEILQAISLFGISMPTFLTGIILILIFSVVFNLLPSFGRGEVVDAGWWSTGFVTWSGLKALILPSITLGLFQMTLLMRLVRTEMLEVLRTDYIKFARARGLTDRAINFGHALKNTLVPVITVAGMKLGSLIAFAIITETVFQWPGMGFLFIQAVHNADIPVMGAYLMMIAFIFVIINLIVDLLYYVVDPRLRIDRAVAGGYES
jgi:peptide/nickel transport system permease protein